MHLFDFFKVVKEEKYLGSTFRYDIELSYLYLSNK